QNARLHVRTWLGWGVRRHSLFSRCVRQTRAGILARYEVLVATERDDYCYLAGLRNDRRGKICPLAQKNTRLRIWSFPRSKARRVVRLSASRRAYRPNGQRELV